MRSSIHFLLALMSSPALAAPMFASKRGGENGHFTPVIDPSHLRIGTQAVVPSSGWNPIFGIGPVIPNFKRAPVPTTLPSDFWGKVFGRPMAKLDMAPGMVKSSTSKRAPVPVMLPPHFWDDVLGRPKVDPQWRPFKRAAPGPGPHPSDNPLMVLFKGLKMAPGMVELSTSKRAPLPPMPLDSLNKFLASHPGAMVKSIRDTSEQDRWAKFLDNARKSNLHDIYMRDAGNQDLWNLLIKGAQAQ